MSCSHILQWVKEDVVQGEVSRALSPISASCSAIKGNRDVVVKLAVAVRPATRRRGSRALICLFSLSNHGVEERLRAAIDLGLSGPAADEPATAAIPPAGPEEAEMEPGE